MMQKIGRWKTLGLMAALALSATTARAYNGSDSLTVTITPTASYSVLVTTSPGAGFLNLGFVGLGASTQTMQASTITVESSYAYTGLELQGAITSPGGTPWTFASNTAALGQDQLAAWAVFTDTSTQTKPAKDVNHFVGTIAGQPGSGVTDATQRIVGTTGGTCPTAGSGGNLFISSVGVPGWKSMECGTPSTTDPAGSQSLLWLYFTLPPTTTDGTHAQLITYTLTAGAPN
jgi:hypothetical protein